MLEILAVFSSLFAFLITFLFGKQIGVRGAQLVTCGGVIIAAIASLMLFYYVDLLHQDFTRVLAPWLTSGDISVVWALRIDQLAVVMMCVINLVSACVHIYSIGYMSHDEHQQRFMAYLSLFTFAMLILVTSNNLLQLFFGWEAVGLASYLLIGFWNKKESANAAAQKAFVVNRVGDFGLALGLMACYMVFGSIEFDTIFANAASKVGTTFVFFGYEVPALLLIGLLLFTGAVGKSAQLGLHTWLPDAMEGPTPVSALIHAATMVTAGVFLIVRFSPLYEYAPDALIVISVFGALTAFVAATTGMTQFDIKRVIAYSTMSQLGYMFFAVGVSAYGAAMFHLVTHAFFKSLLFLGAGSVIHAMSGEQDMRKMGGIWKKIPMTYGLMWVGALALAGIPPFSGFYSKDIVLEAIWMADTTWSNVAFWLVILAAFQTSFYSWRMLLLTFHGKPRADKETMDHVHESPAVMVGPLVFLAMGAIFSGMVLYDSFVGSGGYHAKPATHGEEHAGAGHDVKTDTDNHAKADEKEENVSHGSNSILHYIAPEMAKDWSKDKFWQGSIFVLPENDTVKLAHDSPFWVKRLPMVVGVLGIILVYVMYMWQPWMPDRIRRMFPILYKLFYNKWFFDEIYDYVFVRNSFRLGRFFWLSGDKNTIDRFGPDGSALASRITAGAMSRFQSGYIFQYAFVMFIALVAMFTWFIFQRGGF
jgi:NADH-quinone oxidoreductase subunit L